MNTILERFPTSLACLIACNAAATATTITTALALATILQLPPALLATAALITGTIAGTSIAHWLADTP
jgi:hypothetical protein